MPIHHLQSVKVTREMPKNRATPGLLAGIDGCRSGWCAVILHGTALTVAHYPTWVDLLTELWPASSSQPAPVIAVDMPIGLSDSGARTCDVLAREKLRQNYRTGKNLTGPSSVFPAPARSMLTFKTYADANAWGRSRGTGLSKQAWNLKEKIAEIDAAVTPNNRDGILEAHPELAFLRLNGGQNLATKRSAQGHHQRRQLLNRHGIPIDAVFASLAPDILGIQPDDLADACVLALVAADIAQWHANNPTQPYPNQLSGHPHTDEKGVRMAIHY